MKILDELERYYADTQMLGTLLGDTHQSPIQKALPALIRVARAAESYCRPSVLENTKHRRLADLQEALRDLEISGE